MDRKKNWKSELVLHGRQDPAWWIESVLGDSLWSRQKDICQSIVEHERTAVVACVDRDTEILTETRGFQFFKDLLPSDKVASLENGELKFVLPLNYFEYDYDGELIGYKAKSLDFLITPNHNCYVRGQNKKQSFSLKPADECYGKASLYFNKGDYIFNGKNQYEWSLADYELFGFWFGDGTLFYRTPPGPVRYRITIVQKKYAEYLRELIKRSSFVFRESPKKDGWSFDLENKELATWFLENFYCNGKKSIPQWLKDSTKESLQWFLYGMAMADGSIFPAVTTRRNGSYNIRFYGEELLADDFYEVGIRAGFVVTKNIFYGYEEKRVIQGRETVSQGLTCFSLSFFGMSDCQTGKQYIQTNSSAWYKQKYVGKVYCVQVPSNIIFIRRNGVSHWSGNSFGIGKTMLAARLALWFLCCFKPSKIITTAPTLRQVKDLLWSELRNAHKKAIFPIGGELLQLSLKFDEDHFCVGFSTDAENIDRFTGFHQSNLLVIFDQAGGIDPNIWEASEGLMTSANCKWLAISNSAISTGELANICMPDRRSRFGTWNVLKVKASESPNVVAGKNLIPGLVAYDWVKKREEAWGRDDPLYKIFVEAEFIPDSEMVVVPYKAIVDAFNMNGELGSHIEVGLDVARMGTDSTVWTAVSGSRVMEVKRVTGNTTMQVVGLTVEFVKHLQETYGLPVTAVKIDVIGLGAGVYDRLIELDDDNIEIPVVAVNNAEVQIVVDKERYSNVRAEMAWAFRHRIDHGNVGLAAVQVHDYEIKEYIRGDIQAMRYKITSQGKIQLLPKEELKKNLGRSPDYWDSLVMAFETPGGGPPMLESISSKKEREEEFSITEEEWQILMGTRMPMDDRFFRDVQF